jgi:murein DD-endopeptidase MepM/ murein hydrolase activator NlpD
VRLLDEQGKLVIGVPVTWFWSSGGETKLTERKSDPWLAAQGLGAEYSLDFAMYNVAPSYGIRIGGDYHGDVVDGCGLGSIEQPDYKIHTAYFFEWQLSSEGVTAPIPPIPAPAGDLTHPLPGAVITQHFYQHEEEYARFDLPGHNGTDLGGKPEGTPISAIADGIVAYTGVDADYGNYVRLAHDDYSCYSFYAHCAAVVVEQGQTVEAGQTIAMLGSTGNSTGVHLHLEIRMKNPDGSYCKDAPMRAGRVDPETFCFMSGLTL